MYNTKYPNSVAVSDVPRQVVAESSDVCAFLALGKRRGWKFTVLGQAPLPDKPVRLDDWLIVPASQDLSTWPTRTVERVNALFDAGLKPKAFVIIHEVATDAPTNTPTKVEPAKPFISLPNVKPDLAPVLRGLGILALGIGVLVGLAVVAVAVISLAAILLMPVVLVAGVTGLDPILTAVTEDGYWIEIDRWVEEGFDDHRLDSSLDYHSHN